MHVSFWPWFLSQELRILIVRQLSLSSLHWTLMTITLLFSQMYQLQSQQIFNMLVLFVFLIFLVFSSYLSYLSFMPYSSFLSFFSYLSYLPCLPCLSYLSYLPYLTNLSYLSYLSYLKVKKNKTILIEKIYNTPMKMSIVREKCLTQCWYSKNERYTLLE